MNASPSRLRKPRRRPFTGVRPLALAASVLWMWPASTLAQPEASAFIWPTLAGDAARTSVSSASAPTALGAARWVCNQTTSGEPIAFTPATGVVATALPGPRIFASGKVGGVLGVGGQDRAIAIDAESGSVVWSVAVPGPQLGSWSTPTIDARRGTVLFATGSALIALRQSDGVQVWRSELPGAPINVTPLVTADLGPADRAFVTTDGGFGGASQILCINVSSRDSTLNPFDLGEIVWIADIGSSVGATPAYLDGVAYVASTGLDTFGIGEIRAFDVRQADPASVTARWMFTNPVAEGFFGGVCVRETPDGQGPFVYGASYAFFGGLDSSNLVKVRARDGALVWSAPSNRTSSIPAVLADGRVVLSTGVSGFGSMPSVQMFSDAGQIGALLWDTASSTWMDANQNGVIDSGEFTALGGWNTQPTVLPVASGTGARVMVGTLPVGDGGGSSQYSPLSLLNVSNGPALAGFVVEQSAQAGSSACVLGGGVYSLGVAGLVAFGAPPPRGDVCGDLAITIEDLYRLEQLPANSPSRDINRSGSFSDADRTMLVREIRRDEARVMIRDSGGGKAR